MVRAHLVIKGVVQGVFYRASTVNIATTEKLTGWVRNRPDGTVEAVFEGEKAALKRMVGWCRSGPPMASVEEVLVTWEDYRGEFKEFSTR